MANNYKNNSKCFQNIELVESASFCLGGVRRITEVLLLECCHYRLNGYWVSIKLFRFLHRMPISSYILAANFIELHMCHGVLVIQFSMPCLA